MKMIIVTIMTLLCSKSVSDTMLNSYVSFLLQFIEYNRKENIGIPISKMSSEIKNEVMILCLRHAGLKLQSMALEKVVVFLLSHDVLYDGHRALAPQNLPRSNVFFQYSFSYLI